MGGAAGGDSGVRPVAASSARICAALMCPDNAIFRAVSCAARSTFGVGLGVGIGVGFGVGAGGFCGGIKPAFMSMSSTIAAGICFESAARNMMI